MRVICPTVEAVYFCRAIWTTQITLNRLVKFVFTRSAFCGVLDARRAVDACVSESHDRGL
jgi:hypothetical protein